MSTVLSKEAQAAFGSATCSECGSAPTGESVYQGHKERSRGGETHKAEMPHEERRYACGRVLWWEKGSREPGAWLFRELSACERSPAFLRADRATNLEAARKRFREVLCWRNETDPAQAELSLLEEVGRVCDAWAQRNESQAG